MPDPPAAKSDQALCCLETNFFNLTASRIEIIGHRKQ
jgi:hypothetical protein